MVIGKVSVVEFFESVKFFAMIVEKLFGVSDELFGDAAFGWCIEFIEVDAVPVDGGVIAFPEDLKDDEFFTTADKHIFTIKLERGLDVKFFKRVFECAANEAVDEFDALFEFLIEFEIGVNDNFKTAHVGVVIEVSVAFIIDGDRVIKGAGSTDTTNFADLVELFGKRFESVGIIGAVLFRNLFSFGKRTYVTRFGKSEVDGVVQFFHEELSEEFTVIFG